MTADWQYASTPSVRHVRRTVPLVLGAALAGIAIAVVIVSFVRSLSELDAVVDARVGDARVPGGMLTFESTAEPYTIFLLTPGIENSDAVERQVGGTECLVIHPDGDDSVIRGSRQGTSVTGDEGATVGWFTGRPGTTTITCDYTRAGLAPRDFGVTQWKPTIGQDFILVFVGVGVLIAAIFLMIWGWRGKTVFTT